MYIHMHGDTFRSQTALRLPRSMAEPRRSGIRPHMVSIDLPAGSSVLLAVVVGGAIGISVARRDITEGDVKHELIQLRE